MKQFYRFIIIVFAIVVIGGCTSEKNSQIEPLKEKNQTSGELQSSKNETNHSTEEDINKLASENSVNPSLYYSVENTPEIDVTDRQVLWKQKDLVFTADISKSEGEQVYESDTVISKMQIDSSYGSYSISLDRKPLRVESLSLSNTDFLAVHVDDHEGSRLIVVDLAKEKQVIINDLIPEGSEAINGYNWSPDGKQLACGFGDLGSSFLAIFNIENEELRVVSDEDYEYIPAVVWHKDGLGLDFISMRSTSEEVLLYRYREDSIKEVLKLDEKDRQMIMDKLPIYIK